ncbi:MULTISPECIES: hypothetical protein [unclassified Nocardioides]|uniref:hypothetical protein n=1 Tax=unclassified Nocardioides TaxID=2615069 RepID=UPI0011247459|nr:MULTISPECIES: hypothetical protein [unclassified Nocardioides]
MARSDKRQIPTRSDTVADLLTASEGVVEAPDLEPWDYGWSVEDYRRSATAALTGPRGAVALTNDALGAFERAVVRMLADARVQARWDEEEFWPLVGSLVVRGSSLPQDQRETFFAARIESLRTAGRAFTAQLVANVSWHGPPMIIGNAVIGLANTELLDAARSVAGTRCVVTADEGERWLRERVGARPLATSQPPVGLCSWTVGQRAKAVAQTERYLRDVVDLPLLLERDLRGHEVFRRGEVNRPGERGLTLDRAAVEAILRAADASVELASFPLTVTDALGPYLPVQWYNAEPLPLGDLLQQTYLRDAVAATLEDDDPVARRLRVAARWFAEAHYTTASDDAALALGVSLDALLTGKRALPGAVMADRYALLFADPLSRRQRRREYQRFFGVRSSVAHGGHSGELRRMDLLAEFFELVHQAAWRLLEVKRVFSPSTEDAVDELFDDLRLGVVQWPSEGD